MQLELDDLVESMSDRGISNPSMPQLLFHCGCSFDPGSVGKGAPIMSSVDLKELRNTEANHNHCSKKRERDKRILQIGLVNKNQP